MVFAACYGASQAATEISGPAGWARWRYQETRRATLCDTRDGCVPKELLYLSRTSAGVGVLTGTQSLTPEKLS